MNKFRDEEKPTGRNQTVNFSLACFFCFVCAFILYGGMFLPSIDREDKTKKKKKERKATIPMLSPNVFLNTSDSTFSFKLFKSISLMGPNLVLTCLGQLKSVGSVAP